MAHRSHAFGIVATLALGATTVAAGDFAYVTNQNSEELSILDLDARKPVSVVPIPGKPAGVAVDGAGHVYTVSPDSKVVRRLDSDGAVLAEVQLDGGPIGVAYDADHSRVFVSDWYNARIWVLDARTLGVLRMLETGSAPAGLSVSGDGRWLASADRDSDQVSIYALEGLTLHRRPTVGTRPFGLRFAPDGRLFVANVGTNDVTVIDPQSGETLATVPVGERPYGVAFARGRAFVTNQYADTVSVIDLAGLAVIETLDVGEYPEGIDTTSDGTTVVVANWFSNTVSLIDAATMTVVGEIETADGPRAFGTFIQQRN
ncbi:YVTN family beta-propeller repeat protein [Puniceibacterium confluentis]|uniref:YVTN family beta-propeller repeat protein n=1 Tax=Puniceibacterium confluentis TaxID=1958944 RepID=UPI00356824A3